MSSSSAPPPETSPTMRDVTECPIPPGSLLAKFASRFSSPLVDCFNLRVRTDAASTETAEGFAASFFASPAFQLVEARLLRAVNSVRPFPSVIDGVAEPQSFASGFFQVTEKTSVDLMLDSGQVFTWLAVDERADGVVDFRMGSIPKESTGLVRALVPVHAWYSRVLLSSAVRTHLKAMKGRDDAKEGTQ